MKAFTELGFGMAMTCAFGPAFAGTVITDNLPVNFAIVNVNALQDGAASYNGDQSLWYHPFSNAGSPPQYTVQPGAYNFRVIDPADAQQMFPALTAPQTNEIFTAWTYNSPWILNYLVFDSAALTNFSLPQLFDGDPEWPPFNDPADAYAGSLVHGTYNVIRVGPLGRDSTILTNVFVFPTTETLVFVVPDYGLFDNGGGVSVLVSPSGVPFLSLSQGPGTMTLQWSTNATGFKLAQTISLAPASWTDVSTIPATVGALYSLTLPANSSTMFFRLHKP
jgi:hypothetical protein